MTRLIESFIPGRFGRTPREGDATSDERVNLQIQELKLQMGEKENEPTLMIVREWDLIPPTDRRSVEWPFLNERLYMCIPKKPFIEIDVGTLVSKIVLKADNYSYWNAVVSGSDARKFNGDVNDAGAWKNNLGRMSLKDRNEKPKEAKPLLEIVVGGHDIVGWGSHRRGVDMLGVIKLAKAIGYELPIH